VTTTLQEALLKAGLVSKKKVEGSGRQGPQRQRPPQKEKKSLGFIEGKHDHHLRTECEACKKSYSDVEYYEHGNKSLLEKWLCLKCVDYYKIPDGCRMTVQSQDARSGLFRRQYGPTKVFK